MTIRTALVTGASSGIGLELCRLLLRDGARVVMVARDAERLERAARWLTAEEKSAALKSIAIDLAQPGSAGALHARVEREGEAIDLLVNNAGFGTVGPFAETEVASQTEMIQLNVTSLAELTHLFLPAMLKRRQGRILNVASMAGFLPGPYMATYYATKAFVVSFSEAVAEEVRGQGVTVTTLCPGPTVTAFQARAGMKSARAVRGPMRMEAAPVAEAGYRGALAGERIVIPGMTNKMAIEALRLLPRQFVSAMSRRANQSLKEGGQ